MITVGELIAKLQELVAEDESYRFLLVVADVPTTNSPVWDEDDEWISMGATVDWVSLEEDIPVDVYEANSEEIGWSKATLTCVRLG